MGKSNAERQREFKAKREAERKAALAEVERLKARVAELEAGKAEEGGEGNAAIASIGKK